MYFTKFLSNDDVPQKGKREKATNAVLSKTLTFKWCHPSAVKLVQTN